MPKARSERGRQSSAARTQRQAYHLTCSNCRTRKMKCDGNQPTCGICQVYSDKCTYDKAPPMSQILAMAEKNIELEKTIEAMRASRDGATTGQYTPTSPTGASNPDGSHDNPDDQRDARRPECQSRSSAISISHDSTFTSTSAVENPRHPQQSESPYSKSWQDDRPESCPAPAQCRFWEDAAVQSAAVHLQLPPEKVAHLLKIHWTWVQPTFMFVPRQLFIRDCAFGGPMFSPALLCVICLHSTRFTDHSLSDELLARARLLISQEIHQKPTMPTIQALLQLSAREVGKGTVSLAWLYSGIAFRMAVDLGIFAQQKTPDTMTSIVRQRLAWSCFLWDKAISLYLGRVPSLPDPPEFQLDVPRTCTAEHDLWTPLAAGHGMPIKDYPPMSSWIYSCFDNFCKLSVIINDILLNLYGHKRSNDYVTVVGYIKKARRDLEKWRKASPDHLKLDGSETICPPPHILMQNLVYHTAVILVHRPFGQYGPCRQTCRDASVEVENLLLILERTFGFSHVTYMMAYCCFTAATIAVQDMKQDVPGSQKRVNTYMRALYGCRASCPGIQRSIDIALQSFESNEVSQSESSSQNQRLEPLFAINSTPYPDQSMPEFPYPQLEHNVFEPIPGLDLSFSQYGSLDGLPQQWPNVALDEFQDFLL